MIAGGATDAAIAARLGGGLHRMAVSRHRRNHVVAPAKVLAAVAGKGRDVIEQRAQMLAAAEAGDPSAFVALVGIMADLRKVHERLERTAAAAENDSQRLAVPSLSAQQLRAAEVRAKIGGVGGYGASKAAGQGDRPFSVTINLPDRRISISMAQATASADVPGSVIDGWAETLGDDEGQPAEER
jgi:hypothetical protein